MRVFVAGATGVIGRALVARLVSAGHEVTGMTRSPERAPELERMGARAAIADALDGAAVRDAVLAARPDAVVHQLTAFAEGAGRGGTAATSELRRRATPLLVEAARAAGARRVVAQSICFAYAPKGGGVRREGDALWRDAPGEFGPTVAAADALERAVLDPPDIEGVVLRYGMLYGPGTWWTRDGRFGRAARGRRLPVVGGGDGVWSWLHADDAAAAAAAALDAGEPGVYNVCDDDPAPVREWLPVFADAVGAPRPRNVPALVARPLVGASGLHMMTRAEGAANARARHGLGWEPRWASWRDGFRAAS